MKSRQKRRPNFRVHYQLAVENETYTFRTNLYAKNKRIAKKRITEKHLHADPDCLAEILIINIEPI